MSDHDCGWLECTPYNCQQQRNHCSDASLAAWNINRDGTPAGNPACGAVMADHYGTPRCTLPAGHDSGRESWDRRSAHHSNLRHPVR